MFNPDLGPSGPLPAFGLRQRGTSMLELLIGIAIGLLVIAAAIGTLAIARGTASTVSDISQLQQQASYALRVIGLQLRQAGSLELVQIAPGVGPSTFNDFAGTTVFGTDAPDTLTVGSQPSGLPSLQRDCTGASVSGLTSNPSVFSVNANGSLTCAGANPLDAQPVIANVADFQVTYRVNTGTTAAPTFQLLTATQMTSTAHWQHVRAIEICLDLQGSEPTPDAGATYTNCQGVAASRGARVHFVSRNVFDLRKQNVLETAL